MEQFDLSGQTAIVTGASRGLGFAFAGALARAGANVAMTALDEERLNEAAKEIAALGTRVTAVVCDVRDRAQVESMHQTVVETLGPVDILVNNAGVCIHKDALDLTYEDWRYVMDTNLDGLWFCSQSVGRAMVARGSGSIINVGSMSAQIVNRPQNQAVYNASKAAVHHLTRSLAAEWAQFGVRVNALAPGYIKTERSPVDDRDLLRYWLDDAPMKRWGLPTELAAAVVFLASDKASSFMTGSILLIDGGYSLY